MDDSRSSGNLHQRNPVTFKKHRGQVFWQIYFPLIIVIVLALVAAVLAVMASAGALSKWADISLIYLVLTTMVAALILMALTILGIVGMRRALQAMPALLFRGQIFFFRLEQRLRAISDNLAEPAVKVNSQYAGLKTLFSRRTRH